MDDDGRGDGDGGGEVVRSIGLLIDRPGDDGGEKGEGDGDGDGELVRSTTTRIDFGLCELACVVL